MGVSRTFSLPGFRAGAASAGIKGEEKEDLALFVSDLPAVSSVLFTGNRVQAAPIQWAKQELDLRTLRGVLVNSGNANACTGKEGVRRSAGIATRIDRALGLPRGSILVSSTGVIGVPLPHKAILREIPSLEKKLSPGGFGSAARAIMTTDAYEKIEETTFTAKGKKVSILGIAKGAGMIAPRMGTMLAYFFTDCSLSAPVLERIFRRCAEATFNRIIVDGDMSTNDTAAIFANGATLSSFLRGEDLGSFEAALLYVMQRLALKIVSDGEGASRVVKIEVTGARSRKNAEEIARSVGSSLLVKTSLFGGDLNWGRIIAAAGRTQTPLESEKVELFIGGRRIVGAGMKVEKKELEKAKREAKKSYFEISLLVGKGRGRYFVYASDITYDYIRLNSSHTT